MKHNSKIKLTGDDFVAVGMNYNYLMIPRLAYPKENFEKLKQQILDDQEMVEELRAMWDNKMHDKCAEKALHIMEKYFEKRAECDKSGTARDEEFQISLSSEDIRKIEEKIRDGDDSETQNSKLVNGVVLINTCAGCSIEFVPKNSMSFETLCQSCIGKKQDASGMSA